MNHLKQAVCAILMRGNSVLLIKRRDIPVWVLPGGGIEPGELPEIAACREVLEETGFHVRIVRKIAEYQPVNKLTQLTHFFECVIESGSASKGSETRDVAFFPVDQLPTLLAPPYSSWIADALCYEPHVMIKPVEGASYKDLLRHLLAHPILVARFLLTKIGIHINH